LAWKSMGDDGVDDESWRAEGPAQLAEQRAVTGKGDGHDHDFASCRGVVVGPPFDMACRWRWRARTALVRALLYVA